MHFRSDVAQQQHGLAGWFHRRRTYSANDRKIPDNAPPWKRHSGTDLLLALLLSVLLVGLGGCGSSASGSAGKHVGKWLAIHMFDAQAGWASTQLAILRTSDGGTDWRDVTPWNSLSPFGHVATFLTPQIAWVVQQGDKGKKTSAQVFRTADGGQTWQQADLPDSVSTFTPTSSPEQGIRTDVAVSSVSAIDALHAWVLSTKTTNSGDSDYTPIIYTHVLQTSDGGKTWSVLVPQLPLASEASGTGSAAPAIAWAVLVNATTGWLNGPTPATLLMTQDDGQTWQQRALPALVASLPADGSAEQLTGPRFLDARNAILQTVTIGRGGNDTQYFSVTQDGGATWSNVPTLVLLGTPEMDYLDMTHWSMLPESGVLYTTADGGQHWTIIQPHDAFQRILDVDFLTSSTGWAIGDNTPANGICMCDLDTVTTPVKTSDGGKTWKAMPYDVS